MSKDCSTCNFNTYKEYPTSDYVSCCHPTTIRKLPKWEVGDPEIVNYRTADIHIRDLHYMAGCPAWAPQATGDDVGGSGT
jgi:hypothetical protein